MNQELLYSVCRWLDENILDFCSTDVYRPVFPNWWVATHFWVQVLCFGSPKAVI